MSRQRERGVLVLVLAGRLGTVSAGMLHAELNHAFAEGERSVVVDLSEVDYLSSAGLLVLASVNREMRAQRGGLVLCAVAEPVRIMLDLAEATGQLAIAASRDEAVAQLTGR